MPPIKKAASEIIIPPLEIETVVLHIIGTTPLVLNRWSEKATQEIERKQGGKASVRKEPKDPHQCYMDAFYRIPDQGGFDGNGTPGVPSIAFKSAAVSAATQLSGLTKTFLRGAFHVAYGSLTREDLVPILGTPEMYTAHVRLATGVADIRYRPIWEEWECHVPVRFNKRVISPEQLTYLFQQAGFSVGIGEWRPERDGSMGLFRVGDDMQHHAGILPPMPTLQTA